MKTRLTHDAGFPDLWDLRGYWGACFERDPNTNAYGISHDDWDDMGQNEQRDIAHEHGDDWHGQPPPSQDDNTQSSSQSGNGGPTPPTFKSNAEREQWLADRRQEQWDAAERQRQENVQRGRDDWSRQMKDHEASLRDKGRSDAAGRLQE